MSHPFGNRIQGHISRKYGLTRNKIAEAIGVHSSVVSRMCQGHRLTGPTARYKVVAIIHFFYAEEVLASLDEANGLLDDAGMSGLKDDCPEEAWLLEQLIDEKGIQPAIGADPTFSGGDLDDQDQWEQELVRQLDEWKIVHSEVQDLFLSVLDLEDSVRLFLEKRTADGAKRLEDDWSQHCERRAHIIRQDFATLAIDDRHISEVQEMLRYAHCLPFHIDRFIEHGDEDRFKQIRNSFYAMKDALEALLRLSDQRIRDIANALKRLYDKRQPRQETAL